jgi:hypothetical protein
VAAAQATGDALGLDPVDVNFEQEGNTLHAVVPPAPSPVRGSFEWMLPISTGWRLATVS